MGETLYKGDKKIKKYCCEKCGYENETRDKIPDNCPKCGHVSPKEKSWCTN